MVVTVKWPLQVWELHKEAVDMEAVDMVVATEVATEVMVVVGMTEDTEVAVMTEVTEAGVAVMTEVTEAGVAVMEGEITEEEEVEGEDGIERTTLLPTKKSKRRWMRQPPTCLAKKTLESTLRPMKTFQ